MSTRPICPDDEFINLFREHGGTKAAEILGSSIRSVMKRREGLEKRLGIVIKPPITKRFQPRQHLEEHPKRRHVEIQDGIVLIGSDSHYWPGQVSTAHLAFIKFCKELQPKIVIKNGDELDGATISRFPPINWEERPLLAQEMEATRDRLEEIEKAAIGADFYWPLGNHDARFETRLATEVPQYAQINGFHLKDHFPRWKPCFSVWINDGVVVKHRFKGGIHAARNNTLYAGKTIITGHLHSLKVSPHTDYNGTRWGVDSGCIADPDGPQFDYTEDNPKDWRSGFVVLTFYKGQLLDPELVRVFDKNSVVFRGRVIPV